MISRLQKSSKSKKGSKRAKNVIIRTRPPNRYTTTGYAGGNIYNSATVLEKTPLSMTNVMTVPIEADFPITVSEIETNQIVYNVNGTQMSPLDITTYDIKQQTKATIWNQLKAYMGMVKAVSLQSMTIEVIPIMGKEAVQGGVFYMKASYKTVLTTEELTKLQPICLIVAGQHRKIKPNIPILNEQIVAAPTLSSTDFANKWVAFPNDPDDLDLAIPILHFFQPAYATSLQSAQIEGAYAFMLHLRFIIAMQPNDTLQEVLSPGFLRKAWSGVKKVASNGVVQAIGKMAIGAALSNLP